MFKRCLPSFLFIKNKHNKGNKEKKEYGNKDNWNEEASRY